MDNVVIIDLLKHQIHEMDQDIKSYLEQIEQQKEELKRLKEGLEKIKHYDSINQSAYYKIAKEYLR